MSRYQFRVLSDHGMDECSHSCFAPKRAEFQRWRDEFPYGSTLEGAREASKPEDIAKAELILGLMERFNYQSIAAVMAEEAELLYLLECESWGYKLDEKEKLAQQEAELQQHRSEVNDG